MTDFYDLYERQMNQGERNVDTFWVNYVEGTDGGRHHRWYNIDDALNEAERLARLPNVMGKNVYLFEYIGKCRVEALPITWECPDV